MGRCSRAYAWIRLARGVLGIGVSETESGGAEAVGAGYSGVLVRRAEAEAGTAVKPWRVTGLSEGLDISSDLLICGICSILGLVYFEGNIWEVVSVFLLIVRAMISLDR